MLISYVSLYADMYAWLCMLAILCCDTVVVFSRVLKSVFSRTGKRLVYKPPALFMRQLNAGYKLRLASRKSVLTSSIGWLLSAFQAGCFVTS